LRVFPLASNPGAFDLETHTFFPFSLVAGSQSTGAGNTMDQPSTISIDFTESPPRSTLKDANFGNISGSGCFALRLSRSSG
jgi:hypothetical protein